VVQFQFELCPSTIEQNLQLFCQHSEFQNVALSLNQIADNCIPLNRDIAAFVALSAKECTPPDVKTVVKGATGRVPFAIDELLPMMVDFFENTKVPRPLAHLTFEQFKIHAYKNGLDFILTDGLAPQRAKLALSLCKNYPKMSKIEVTNFLSAVGVADKKVPTAEELAKQAEELRKIAEREAKLGVHGRALRKHTKALEAKEKKEAEKAAKDKERAEQVEKERKDRADGKRKRGKGEDSSSRKKPKT
jgi:hypothetical protein